MLSTCISLLLSLAVIPLISGVFEDSVLDKPWFGPATQQHLRPTVNGEYALTAGFTYYAYNFAWRHNSTAAPFTTEQYAVLPVVNTTALGEPEMWTTDTTVYDARLRCDTAETDIRNTPERGISIDISTANKNYTVFLCDRRLKDADHTATQPTPQCDLYTTFLTPWTSIAYQIPDSNWGQTNDVLSRAEQTYLFAWASGANPAWDLNPATSPSPRKIAALFCTTSYFSQPATVSFHMPSGVVTTVAPHSPSTRFTGITNFESAVAGAFDPAFATHNGSSSSSDAVTVFGYLPQQLPNVDRQLIEQFGERPSAVQSLFTPLPELMMFEESNSSVYMDDVYTLSWYVLANMTARTLDTLLVPETLARGYEKALQQWFALAVSIEMVDSGGPQNPHAVQRFRRAKGFKVSRLWARCAEAGVVVVVLLAVVLAVGVAHRTCNLDGEPITIAAALRLLDASPELCHEMEDAEYFTPAQIRIMLEQGNHRFRLELVPGVGPRVVVVAETTQVEGRVAAQAGTGAKAYASEQLMLRAEVGVALVVVVGAVAALLTVVFTLSIRWGGESKILCCCVWVGD